MSPYLFLLAVESLYYQLKAAVDEGRILSFKFNYHIP